MTLDFARSTAVEPGSNPRGEQADTNWLFLLPSLALRDVLVIGTVPYGTLVALGALSQRVTAATVSAAMRQQLHRLSAERSVAVTESADAPGVDEATPDLVCVGADALARIAGGGEAFAWLRQALEAGCPLYLAPPKRGEEAVAVAERLGIETGVSIGRSETEVTARAARGASAWLIPESSSAPPRPARSVHRALRAAARLARSIASPGSPGLGASASDRVSERDRALAVASVAPLPETVPARTGVLMRPLAEAREGSLPRYLLEAAEAAGLPLSATGWRLAPPRGYRSQKVIFFVRASGTADVIVKITQDPRFNRLLENEAYALEELERFPVEDGPIAPRLRFRARHAGLAVVAEDALPGRSYVTGSPDHSETERALAVTGALTALAVRTARPGVDVREAIGEVVGEYERLYDPGSRQLEMLGACAERLGDLGGALPLVFMHGDATVYNVLVDDSSKVGLVDWENAEPAGLPLWDLLHFLQTRAAWSVERAGRRYTRRRFESQFLRGRQAGSLEARAIERHVRELGIPEEAVEPLLYTWLARHAVREARQLPASDLNRGTYQRLLVHALKAGGQ